MCDRYFAFWGYGSSASRKEFDRLADVLDLVKKAAENEYGYRDLVIIEGRKLEFEPAKVVEVWRVKDQEQP
jgi:hypothetical protein